MKLLLRRDQKSGLIGGKVAFILEVRAELDEEEAANVKKYKIGDTVIYKNYEVTDPGHGLLGLASRVAFKALSLTITVNDLTRGKRIECKDIVEMLSAEEQIKEACQTFTDVLNAASQFGGEEVIEY